MDEYPKGYREARALLWAAARLFNRVAVTGLEHVPRTGAALICASHEGMSDPVFLMSAIGHRHVRAIAEKAFTDVPVLGTFMRAMGSIPVDVRMGRTADKLQSDAAVDAMVAWLESGGVGLWFPEGIIKFWTDGHELAPFRTGAVRAAARASVPVIPAALYGSRWAFANVHRWERAAGNVPVLLPLLLPVKVRIVFGPPMLIDPRALERDVAVSESARVRAAVEHLRDGLRTA